jgi:hypothetical protein
MADFHSILKQIDLFTDEIASELRMLSQAPQTVEPHRKIYDLLGDLAGNVVELRQAATTLEREQSIDREQLLELRRAINVFFNNTAAQIRDARQVGNFESLPRAGPCLN